MSGENNSPVSSGASKGQKPTTWRRPCNEPITNESSVNVGSDVLSSISDSIRSSSQCSYSNAAPPIPPTLNHNSYTNSNAGVFQNDLPSTSLGLPNGGQKSYYKEEINNVNFSGGDSHSQGRYGYQYDQDRRHEQWSNSYRGSSGCMPPCMQFPREKSRLYMAPTISPPMYTTFNSNVIPFNSNVIPSGASNGQKPTTWRRPWNKPITNESSVNIGSNVLSSHSDSIRSSSQCSYSNAAPPNPPTLNHNSHSNNNDGVFHNDLHSTSLGVLNGGQKPYYKEEINNVNFSGGDTHSQGGYGYQYGQDRRHEQWSNSYRGSSDCMSPSMQFLREQSRPYMAPTISPPMYPTFISNVIPFNWCNAHEVPNVITSCPQLQYLCGSYVIPNQGFYAVLQSKFSFLLVNLRANLRKQIEYYFSSENLCTDNYLKKHMDDHGWVQVTLIAQFMRVQQLMKERQFIYDSFRLWSFLEMQVKPLADDMQFILNSLRPSYSVELQGDKVRKRHEWEK